jgi:DNA repair protein RadD
VIELRYYQQDAKEAFYDHLTKRDDNPCIVIPTAGGKTPVIASICADAVNLWQGRVLVLAHVKELLEQTADKLNKMCPEVRYGIYSAGLGRREKSAPVVIAGIQSVFRRAEEMGAFDLVLVDEAHMIPPDGDGMYRQFLAEAKTVNPEVRVGGLTATPYRLKTGPICTPDGILNHVCYEVGVRELMARGHISKVTSKDAKAKADLSKVDIRRGEFDIEQMESAFNQDDLVEAACREIIERAGQRKSILIFTSGICHGEHVTQVHRRLTGEEVNFLTGETDTLRRDEILNQFKEQAYRWLVNVNVLTTGFDAPAIDCVALLRSTLSPGLYYQMVGRGFRLHPGKENCLVLDFGGNVVSTLTLTSQRKACSLNWSSISSRRHVSVMPVRKFTSSPVISRSRRVTFSPWSMPLVKIRMDFRPADRSTISRHAAPTRSSWLKADSICSLSNSPRRISTPLRSAFALAALLVSFER